MKKAGKIIWTFNITIILLFIASHFVFQMEDKESGLTFRQLYFDEELSDYVGRIPNSLLGLMERNPEAKEFVLNYPEYQGFVNGFEEELSVEDIDTDLVAEEGMLPLFLQWDERWGYERYGDDYIAINGCGPTCLAMVYCGLSQDILWNPYAVAKMAEDGGFYVEGAGSSWELMSSGAEEIGLVVHTIAYDAAHIVEAIQGGIPIICAMRQGDFTTSGHFIVLCGVNDVGDIVVRDPNSIINSEKSWTIEQLMPQIKNLWGYGYSG